MVIQLTPETEALIRDQVARGPYATAEAVIAEAVRLLAERSQRLQRLRAELAIGEEQEQRGELFELTDERFARIKHQAQEDARAGKPIRDGVKP